MWQALWDQDWFGTAMAQRTDRAIWRAPSPRSRPLRQAVAAAYHNVPVSESCGYLAGRGTGSRTTPVPTATITVRKGFNATPPLECCSPPQERVTRPRRLRARNRTPPLASLVWVQ
jgi:hypothetical protein